MAICAEFYLNAGRCNSCYQSALNCGVHACACKDQVHANSLYASCEGLYGGCGYDTVVFARSLSSLCAACSTTSTTATTTSTVAPTTSTTSAPAPPSSIPPLTSTISTILTSTTSKQSSTQITTTSSSSSSSTHSSIPPYTGSGDLLQGYCVTPLFTLIPGSISDLYIGVVGCVDGKDDCCPFSVASTYTSTDTVTSQLVSTVTILLGGASSTQIPASITSSQAFPVPISANQATLQHCPDDYQTVSDVCCPSGYLLWQTMIGGVTPCYSSLATPLTPPPLFDTRLPPSGTMSTHSISAIVNVVYAMQYPVEPTQLSTAAKIGIGAGVGAFALISIAIISLFCWRRRRNRSVSAGQGVTGDPQKAPTPSVNQSSYADQNNAQYAYDSHRRPTIPNIPSQDGYMPPSHHQAYMQQGGYSQQQLPQQYSPPPMQYSPSPPLLYEPGFQPPQNFGPPPIEMLGYQEPQRSELGSYQDKSL